MTTSPHPDGAYRFVPGISAYSGGVIAEAGHAIHHVTLRDRLPWQDGFERIATHLASIGRPKAALCAIELRCPHPHPFDSFGSFNDDYRAILDSWGVLVDGTNPVARTNVAPLVDPPGSTVLHAFSYTAEADAPAHADGVAPSFVIAGAGDLVDQSDLRPEAIVREGDTSAEAMREKATCVLDEMESRMTALGVGWSDVTVTDVYTVEPVRELLDTTLIPRIGTATRRGITWHVSHPPILGLAFEMDLRGNCTETWI